jgi:hypothetical protein
MIQITPEERAVLRHAQMILGRILGEQPAVEAEPAPQVDDPRWMKLSDYARSRSIGRRTLDVYIAQGLPTKGRGKSRRVIVADADSWLEKRRG